MEVICGHLHQHPTGTKSEGSEQEDEIASLSTSELSRRLQAVGIPFADCIENSDLVDRLRDHVAAYDVDESLLQRLLKYVLEIAIHGGGAISSAEKTASDYLEANNYDREAA